MGDGIRSGPGKPRDLALIDAIDALPRRPFAGQVWRVVRAGRDPALGAPSHSRWCNGTFDVLYTSLERDGALAEIHAFLALQPVFPSKIQWDCHALTVTAQRTLRIADFAALEKLGVDTARYTGRDYKQTQAIADAAYFLDFDGLLAPSARWACDNLMLFTDRLGAGAVKAGKAERVEWAGWRKRATGPSS